MTTTDDDIRRMNALPINVATDAGVAERNAAFAQIDTLHELLGAAMDDFQKIASDPRYLIVMGQWHEPDKITGKCHVCLAGCVMARRLGASTTEDVRPPDELDDVDVRGRLEAIDSLRQGLVTDAMDSLYDDGIEWTQEQEDAGDAIEKRFAAQIHVEFDGHSQRILTHSGVARTQFIGIMRELQAALKEAGL